MSEAPPLAGIKVIDLTRYLAGPFCTQILGDYGAEIVKVEPVEGRARRFGQVFRQGQLFLPQLESLQEKRPDRYQKSSRPRSPDAPARSPPMSWSITSGPALSRRWASATRRCRARNPRIITCSISGFGSTGPLRDYPGFDQIAQGMSGLMSVTGTAESGPTRVGIAICDLLGGIFSAQGILLALEARHRTGRGQRVETSLLESIVSILSWSAGIYFDTGHTPGPAGNNHPLSSPHGVFKASDRVFNIAVGNEAMWRKFVGIIGRPELAKDDRFTGTGHRIKYRDALTAEINQALAAHPAQYWIDLLNREGIPAGPILTIEEMFNHPQTAAREMLLKLPHPAIGTYLTTGLAAKLSETPGHVTRPPLLGEHTEEVLRASGFIAEEIAKLKEAKAVK